MLWKFVAKILLDALMDLLVGLLVKLAMVAASALFDYSRQLCQPGFA